MKIRLTIVGLVLVLGFAGWASAASLTMNRNTETDMAWYRAFTCTTDPACLPNVRMPGLDMAQPATGPPSLVIPLTASGRIAYKAEDTVGNQSPLSNIIPFRGAALNAPTGLLQMP